MLTDFQNSFNVKLSSKHVMKESLNVSFNNNFNLIYITFFNLSRPATAAATATATATA